MYPSLKGSYKYETRAQSFTQVGTYSSGLTEVTLHPTAFSGSELLSNHPRWMSLNVTVIP
jgi:hypothetical protein